MRSRRPPQTLTSTRMYECFPVAHNSHSPHFALHVFFLFRFVYIFCSACVQLCYGMKMLDLCRCVGNSAVRQWKRRNLREFRIKVENLLRVKRVNVRLYFLFSCSLLPWWDPKLHVFLFFFLFLDRAWDIHRSKGKNTIPTNGFPSRVKEKDAYIHVIDIIKREREKLKKQAQKMNEYWNSPMDRLKKRGKTRNVAHFTIARTEGRRKKI